MKLFLSNKNTCHCLVMRLFTLCMCLFLCGTMSATKGESIKIDNFEYVVLTESGSTGTVQLKTVIDKSKLPSSLTIPSEITHNSVTYKVTSIVGYVFNGCSGLTSITIPEGVTSISDGAFQGCSSLTSITIPKGVTSIGQGAFNGCSGLTSITIPEGVESINDYAFQGCSSLTSITIPKSVTSIGPSAFDGLSLVFYLGDELPTLLSNSGSFTCYELFLKPSTYRKSESIGLIRNGSLTNSEIAHLPVDKIDFTLPRDNYTATMCRDFDVDLRHTNDNLPLGVEPLKAYIVKDVDVRKNVIELQEIKYVPSRLKSNEDGYKGYDEYVGVLLKGKPGYTYYYTIGEEDYTKGKDGQMTLEKALALSGASVPTTTASFVGCNDSKYITSEETVDGVTYQNYGLKDNEFHPFEIDGNIDYNKAYLRIPVTSGSSAKQNFTLVFHDADGTTSSVSSVSLSKTISGDNFIYDLQGMKISAPVKGKVYIQNGKKYLQK